jgi:hypothetical protein
MYAVELELLFGYSTSDAALPVVIVTGIDA